MTHFLFILSGLVLFYILIKKDIESDFKKWVANQDVHHAKEWWIRVAFVSSVIFLFTAGHPGSFLSNKQTLYVVAGVSLLIGFFWWLLEALVKLN